MAIDQSGLGKHIQEQMQAIENDPGVPEDAEIGSVITLVEVRKPGEGPEAEGAFRNMRVRSNVQPHVAIGLLEEAKAIQLGMTMGS